MCIRTGDIVWAHGGVPCGEWPDLRLARDAYTGFVKLGEKTLADKGYKDGDYFIFPTADDPYALRKKQIMARHETLNRRLKKFSVLGIRFRHSLELHPKCFHAVVNLTQVEFNCGYGLYSVF